MQGLQRLGWDEPRPAAAPPRRVWRDWALVTALVPPIVLEGTLRADLPYRVLSVVIVLALVPTLLGRRTSPPGDGDGAGVAGGGGRRAPG